MMGWRLPMHEGTVSPSPMFSHGADSEKPPSQAGPRGHLGGLAMAGLALGLLLVSILGSWQVDPTVEGVGFVERGHRNHQIVAVFPVSLAGELSQAQRWTFDDGHGLTELELTSIHPEVQDAAAVRARVGSTVANVGGDRAFLLATLRPARGERVRTTTGQVRVQLAQRPLLSTFSPWRTRRE